MEHVLDAQLAVQLVQILQHVQHALKNIFLLPMVVVLVLKDVHNAHSMLQLGTHVQPVKMIII